MLTIIYNEFKKLVDSRNAEELISMRDKAVNFLLGKKDAVIQVENVSQFIDPEEFHSWFNQSVLLATNKTFDIGF